MRIALAIVLLLAAIPLGVTAGVMVVAGTLSDHALTREGWEMAAASGAAGLVALLVGSWLLSRERSGSRPGERQA